MESEKIRIPTLEIGEMLRKAWGMVACTDSTLPVSFIANQQDFVIAALDVAQGCVASFA